MQQPMTEEQRKELEEKIKNMGPEELREFQKQQCIFCQIIAGKIPSKKVYGDEKCLAVMDINPASIGHVLLMPKEHYTIMPQIPEEVIGHMFMVSKHLSQAMLRKLKVEGTNIFVANGLVAGQKAQHFMIHVIPRREGDGILSFPEHSIDEQMREKVGLMVGNRMNELMGIKKEKVKIAEGKEKEEPVEETPAEEPAEEPVKEPVKETIEEPAKESKEEEDKDSEDGGEGGDEGDGGEESDEENKDDKDEEADLDDIANLFK